jgi:DNA modification methylase
VTPYYQEAGITIYHGDCREILPQLGRFDLLLTDPPYGAGYAANPIVGKGKNRSNHESQGWDDFPVDDFGSVLDTASHAVVWGGNYYPLRPSRCWLTWYKPDSPPSMADLEMAWVSRDGNAKQFNWSIAATNGERVGHPTQKPLALIKWCLSLFPEAKTVLDPFCGSGTTLVAAKDMGLTAVGIEAEERYCEIAANRLRQSVLNFEAVS